MDCRRSSDKTVTSNSTMEGEGPALRGTTKGGQTSGGQLLILQPGLQGCCIHTLSWVYSYCTYLSLSYYGNVFYIICAIFLLAASIPFLGYITIVLTSLSLLPLKYLLHYVLSSCSLQQYPFFQLLKNIFLSVTTDYHLSVAITPSFCENNFIILLL